VFLHGARVKREEREGRREGDARENQRHAEIRRAGRAALESEELERAEPLEGPDSESDGDQGEIARAQKMRAEDEQGESRGEEAQGRAA
jgi:hypothetical protein